MRAAIVAAVAAVSLALVGCDGGDGKSTPAATPTPVDATKTASVTPGATTPPTLPPAAVLKAGAPQAQPRGSKLYIVTGCTACDGPDESLQVHTTGPDGAPAVTTLLGVGHPALAQSIVGQISGSADGSIVAAVACSDVYCGGMGSLHPVALWQVLVSADRGATWHVAYEKRTNYVSIADVSPGGIGVVDIAIENGVQTITYAVIGRSGGLREVERPAAAGRFPWLHVLPSGEAAWVESRSLSGEEGDQYFRANGEVPLLHPPGTTISGLWELPDGTIAASWAGSLNWFGLYGPAGGAPFAWYELDGLVITNVPSRDTALANTRGIGAFPGTIFPILVDLKSGTATPFTNEVLAAEGNRNTFIGYVP